LLPAPIHNNLSNLKYGAVQAFSTTPTRAHDLAKLTLIGRLGKDPEVRTTVNDKEYVTFVFLSYHVPEKTGFYAQSSLSYTVVTRNYPPPPPDEHGSRSS
jgi:hypothetical protein